MIPPAFPIGFWNDWFPLKNQPGLVTMPRLVGLRPRPASQILKQLGFPATNIQLTPPDGGSVATQTPAAGSAVDPAQATASLGLK